MVGILRILLLCAVAGLAHAKILSTNNNTSPFLINSAVPLVDASSGGTNICTAKNALVTAEFTTNIKAIFYNRMICPFGIPVIAHQDVPDANIIFTANIVARYLDKNQDGVADNAATVTALKNNKVVFVLGISATTSITNSLTTVTSTLTKAWVPTIFPIWDLTAGTTPAAATAADRIRAEQLIYETVFKTILTHGWGPAFKTDVGITDFTSIACKEMQRIACCNPGWNHPGNLCPGQTGSANNYQFPSGHSFRSPGTAQTGVSPMVTGTCTASTCDCMNFITQATLIYIGATPYSAYGSQMPRTSNDIKGMLAPAFKTMMDQGKILTRVDEVSGKYTTSVFNVGFTPAPAAAPRSAPFAWGFLIAAATLVSALSARTF